MSAMKELDLDIQMMIEEGTHPVTIARILGVPVTWVYDTLEHMEPDEEVLSPFITINS
jgi:hypothetical protein